MKIGDNSSVSSQTFQPHQRFNLSSIIPYYICKGKNGNGGWGSAMSNSIITNIFYFNTRPLFETRKKLLFSKIFHNFGQIWVGGNSTIFLKEGFLNNLIMSFIITCYDI